MDGFCYNEKSSQLGYIPDAMGVSRVLYAKEDNFAAWACLGTTKPKLSSRNARVALNVPISPAAKMAGLVTDNVASLALCG